METMRPVMVGISAASGSAMPPLVCRFGSSLRTRTRAPIGSTYSKTFWRTLDMQVVRVNSRGDVITLLRAVVCGKGSSADDRSGLDRSLERLYIKTLNNLESEN